MASDRDLKSINDIFRETYGDKIKDLLPDSTTLLDMVESEYPRCYSDMSTKKLTYRVERYNDEKAKKELEKRELPLWKALNE